MLVMNELTLVREMFLASKDHIRVIFAVSVLIDPTGFLGKSRLRKIPSAKIGPIGG